MNQTSVMNTSSAALAANTQSADTFDMAALLAAHPMLPAPARNTVVTGTVISKAKDGYFVDCGRKGDSFVPNKEGGVAIELTVGSTHTFYVTSDPDENGAVELSYLRVKKWEDVQNLRESGETTPARVLDVAKSRAGQVAGLHVSIGGLRGFVPRTEVQAHARLETLKGTEIPVKVIEADMLKGRNGELVCSHAKAVQAAQDEVLAELKVGAVVPGVVTKIILEKADRRDASAPRPELGALVDLGGITALVHRTEVSDSRSDKPSDVLTVGQEIAVEILSIDHETRSVRLSYKRVKQAIFLGQLAEGDVVEGVVKNVDPNIGYFVRLGGCIDGLLHRRELASKDSLASGQSVTVKVIKITADGKTGRTRIALSRKGL